MEKIEVYFAVFGWKFNLEQSHRPGEERRDPDLAQEKERFRIFLPCRCCFLQLTCQELNLGETQRAGRDLSVILGGESKENY